MGKLRASVNSNSQRLRIKNFHRRATYRQSSGLRYSTDAGERYWLSLSPQYSAGYSYFFRHTFSAAETLKAKPPSKLGSSFRPVFWLGVSRSERPFMGRKWVLGFVLTNPKLKSILGFVLTNPKLKSILGFVPASSKPKNGVSQ
jgi:hypothetical protein